MKYNLYNVIPFFKRMYTFVAMCVCDFWMAAKQSVSGGDCLLAAARGFLSFIICSSEQQFIYSFIFAESVYDFYNSKTICPS